MDKMPIRNAAPEREFEPEVVCEGPDCRTACGADRCYQVKGRILCRRCALDECSKALALPGRPAWR